MNTETSKATSSGLGIASVLTIVFVVLKLTNNIDWSWWWVLSPLWINGLVAIVVVFFVVLIGLIVGGRR